MNSLNLTNISGGKTLAIPHLYAENKEAKPSVFNLKNMVVATLALASFTSLGMFVQKTLLHNQMNQEPSLSDRINSSLENYRNNLNSSSLENFDCYSIKALSRELITPSRERMIDLLKEFREPLASANLTLDNLCEVEQTQKFDQIKQDRPALFIEYCRDEERLRPYKDLLKRIDELWNTLNLAKELTLDKFCGMDQKQKQDQIKQLSLPKFLIDIDYCQGSQNNPDVLPTLENLTCNRQWRLKLMPEEAFKNIRLNQLSTYSFLDLRLISERLAKIRSEIHGENSESKDHPCDSDPNKLTIFEFSNLPSVEIAKFIDKLPSKLIFLLNQNQHEELVTHLSTEELDFLFLTSRMIPLARIQVDQLNVLFSKSTLSPKILNDFFCENAAINSKKNLKKLDFSALSKSQINELFQLFDYDKLGMTYHNIWQQNSEHPDGKNAIQFINSLTSAQLNLIIKRVNKSIATRMLREIAVDRLPYLVPSFLSTLSHRQLDSLLSISPRPCHPEKCLEIPSFIEIYQRFSFLTTQQKKAISPYLNKNPVKIDLKSLELTDLEELFFIHSADENYCRQMANSFSAKELNPVLSTFYLHALNKILRLLDIEKLHQIDFSYLSDNQINRLFHMDFYSQGKEKYLFDRLSEKQKEKIVARFDIHANIPYHFLKWLKS